MSTVIDTEEKIKNTGTNNGKDKHHSAREKSAYTFCGLERQKLVPVTKRTLPWCEECKFKLESTGRSVT